MAITHVDTGASSFIETVIRRRWWVLALWATVTVASTFVYLSKFRIDNSVAIWFLEDDPELEAYRNYNREFGEKEWTYVWLRGDLSVYTPAFLRDLRLLRDEVESLEDVAQVLSLTDARGIGPGPGPDGEPVFQGFLQAGPNQLPTEEKVALLQERIRGTPRFDGRLVARDDERFTMLAIQNANRIDVAEPYRRRLIDAVREAVSSVDSIQDFGIVGTTVVNAELNRAAERDVHIYYALIAGIVLVGGGLALRRSRDLVVLCAVVVGTVLPVVGAIGAVGLPFNLMTVMLPTLLVTVSVSYLIHFLGEFHAKRGEQLELGGEPDTSAAISATFRQLLRPGLWTSVTTAIGFASLAISPVEPIRHLGFSSALGIGLGWINTITVAPALLSLLWDQPERICSGGTSREGARPPLVWLARPHPLLAFLICAGILAGASGVFRLEADTDYVKFFRRGSAVRNDYTQIQDLGLPGSYLTVIVKLPGATPIADIRRHRATRRLEEALRSLPAVLDVQGLDRTVAQMASELPGTTPVEPDAALVGQLLTMHLSGHTPLTEDFLASGGGKMLRLRVLTAPMSTSDISAFRGALEGLSWGQPKGWEVALTGTNVLWANMDAHVVKTQLFSILIVAVALLLLLPVIFRSIAIGILGLLVSFVPVLCTLGLMGWFGLPVNIATCILGGVVIGIAVDDTIYYLSRVQEGLRLGLEVEDATSQACQTTGRAMIKTSLILTGGFLTMAASDFMPSVYFGVFFAFSMVVALLADLLVLPALLRVVIVVPEN